MIHRKAVAQICAVGICVLTIAFAGCSRQQSDWQKTRETNTAEAYEQFLKKYPSGEFTAQAEARVKELYEERDWQKARDTDTPEAYQAFVKQYPEGKWTEEARIRVENFTLAQAPSGTAPPSGAAASPGAAGSAGSAAPPGTPAGVASAAPAAAASPEPDRPAAAPSAPKPAAKSAAPKSQAKLAAGAFGVQLGAFKSGPEAAHKRWAELQKEHPALFGGLSSKVLSTKTSDGNLYRLQTIGVTEKRAREICSSMKAASQACVVVPPRKT